MISISSIEADVNGHIIINEQATSVLKDVSARVKNVPALNGKVITVHHGFNKADSILAIRASITKTEEAKLWYIYENKPYILLVETTNCYLASIKRLKTDNGQLFMDVLISNNELE